MQRPIGINIPDKTLRLNHTIQDKTKTKRKNKIKIKNILRTVIFRQSQDKFFYTF